MNKCSFIIPVYNSYNYIEDTILSIENNCPYEKEILLIDDCSEDIENLKIILDKYSDIRILTKNNKTNAADSRNIGLEKSIGQYVFFIDSDDKLLPDSISRRIELHDLGASGVIFGNYLCNKKGKKFSSKLSIYESSIDPIRYLLFLNGDFRSSTISLSKKNFKGTLFDKNSYKHQDWIFFIRCIRNNEVVFFDNELFSEIELSGNRRMSKRLNYNASKYFCDNYLIKREYINKFVTIHWRPIIRNFFDKECFHFLKLYKLFR